MSQPTASGTSAGTLTSTGIYPLTTIFTPPAPCFSGITSTIAFIPQSGFTQAYFVGGGDDPVFQSSSCYPSSWMSTAQVFSPGICPSGYTSGCLETRGAETSAICCPSNWSCNTVSSTLIGDVFYSQPWVATYPCVSYPSGTVTVTSFTEFSETSGIAVNALGVSIRWQQTDFAWTSSTGSIPTISASSSGTASPSPTPTAKNSSLSTGAKAGIGVGVSLLALLAVAIAFFLFRRRRNSKTSQHNERGDDLAKFEKPELDSNQAIAKAELEANARGGIQEIDSQQREELQGDERTRGELEANQRVVHEKE